MEINLKNGDISAYGLACGYIDVKPHTTADNVDMEIRLSFNGATYDVDAVISGEAREFLPAPSGHKIMSGWAQFDTLTDARKFQRSLVSTRNKQTSNEIFQRCLALMD